MGEKGIEAVDAFLTRPLLMPAGTGSRCCRLRPSPGPFGPATRPWRRIKAAARAGPAKKTAWLAQPPAEPADARGLDRKGTDLAAALEVAAAAVPPFYVPRIVLLSDGNPTTGDALKAAASLHGKVEVLTVPLPVPHRARGAALGRDRAGPGAPGRAVQRRGLDR